MTVHIVMCSVHNFLHRGHFPRHAFLLQGVGSDLNLGIQHRGWGMLRDENLLLVSMRSLLISTTCISPLGSEAHTLEEKEKESKFHN